MPGGSASRFDALDLLRGVAALAVVTLHVTRPEGPAPALPHAYLAVDLFFALSGFVIAHAYWQKLIDGEQVARFMLRRLIRLYPLYLVATLAGALLTLDALLPSGQPERSFDSWLVSLGANLLFLPAPPGNGGAASGLFPAVFPAWSLFWELVANLIFALLAPRLGWRMLGAILGVGLVLLVATGAAYGTLDAGVRWDNFWGGGGRVIWTFFLGVALQRFCAGRQSGFALPGWLLGGLLLAVLAVPKIGWGYDVAMAALVLPLLVFLGAQVRGRSATGHWLGYVSYALYVLHAPLLNLLDKLTVRFAGLRLDALPQPLSLALGLAVTLAAAAALSRRYDDPVRAWLTGIVQRKWTPRGYSTTRPPALP
jgi:peptidoglycan/LPS O-acetylase OafA/YrhL